MPASLPVLGSITGGGHRNTPSHHRRSEACCPATALSTQKGCIAIGDSDGNQGVEASTRTGVLFRGWCQEDSHSPSGGTHMCSRTPPENVSCPCLWFCVFSDKTRLGGVAVINQRLLPGHLLQLFPSQAAPIRPCLVPPCVSVHLLLSHLPP